MGRSWFVWGGLPVSVVVAGLVGLLQLQQAQRFLPFLSLCLTLLPNHVLGCGPRWRGQGSCVWAAVVVWVGVGFPLHIQSWFGGYVSRSVGLLQSSFLLVVMLVVLGGRNLAGMAGVVVWVGVVLALGPSGCGRLLAAAWPPPL